MSQKRYDELVEAGAPRLPQGYSYSIDWSVGSNSMFAVMIIQSGLFGKVVSSTVSFALYSPNEKRMLKRLVRACRRSERRGRREITGVGSYWTGDHP